MKTVLGCLFSKRSLITALILLLITSYALADIDLGGSDKVEHYFWGMSLMGLAKNWKFTDKQAYLAVLSAALMKEAYDWSIKGEAGDPNDVIATMLGGISFKLIDGVHFWLIYRK